MSTMTSQTTSLTIVYSTGYPGAGQRFFLFDAQVKENIKAPRHWPLWGEFTGYRWIPHTKGQKHGKCFHLMTSSWNTPACISAADIYQPLALVGVTHGGGVKHTLPWRHNGRDSVSNHQPHGCLLNRLFRRRLKKTSKLRVTGLCAGIHRGPVNSLHKWLVTRKMFPFDDIIMKCVRTNTDLLLIGT